jgi:hypothetical protein
MFTATVAFLGSLQDRRWGNVDVEEWLAEPAELADVLRDALSDEYAYASPDEMDDALDNVLGAMSPAEAFNFGKALRQLESGARKALSDPVVAQIAQTALPVAAGALGTAIGGPAGTAIGSNLGALAAKALPGAPKPVPQAPAAAGGSAAAAQGLVLTQQPDVLQALLSLAMGQLGQQKVNGVPVGQVMNMLSSVFGQAAADADELMYRGDDEDGEESPSDPSGRALYSVLLDAENDDLAEAVAS